VLDTNKGRGLGWKTNRSIHPCGGVILFKGEPLVYLS